MQSTYLKNCWYVAAWSYELSDRPLGRKILNVPICLYRGSQGHPIAMEDFCAHRGAPLSKGRVEDGAIRCMYHGVKFGPDGGCCEIPGQDRIPIDMRVKTLPVVEKNNWIWIWMGDPEKVAIENIPDAWSLNSSEWEYKPGYHHFSAPQSLLCDNLLDFSHIAFVHPGTLGGTENIALSEPKIAVQNNGIHVERWLLNDVPAPFHTRVAKFSGNVDRWHYYDFLFPGVLLMHSGVQRSTGDIPTGFSEDALEFRSCQAVTPETDEATHYFFAVPRNFELKEPKITETIFNDAITAFNEDKVMIEAQAERLREFDERRLVAIRADKGLIQYRRLLSEKIREEAGL